MDDNAIFYFLLTLNEQALGDSRSLFFLILFYLLIAGLLFLLGKSVVLLRNRLQFRGLVEFSDTESEADFSVAVCIPARNEEANIKKCVSSVLKQTWRKTSVYVLNDRSDDGTSDILNNLKAFHPDKLQIFEGKPKPDGWLGKPWACHQISKQTKEEIIVFIDADTWLEPNAIKNLVRSFNKTSVDFITVWPHQHTLTFWERTIVPLVYYALLSFLTVRYTERKPFWMPAFFHRKFRSLFAAACGQFMAFRKEVYQAIGGHEIVKDRVVEDVQLARSILARGFRMRMYHGMNVVNCRMYANHNEIFNGFRKNFLAGFDYNIPLFLLMAFLHVAAYLIPLGVLVASYFVFIPTILVSLSLLNFMLMTLHRVLLSTWFGWPAFYAFTHPLGVLWFQVLAWVTISDRITKRKVSWKGDKV